MYLEWQNCPNFFKIKIFGKKNEANLKCRGFFPLDGMLAGCCIDDIYNQQLPPLLLFYLLIGALRDSNQTCPLRLRFSLDGGFVGKKK